MQKILFLVNHQSTLINFRIELLEELISNGDKVFVSSPIGDRIGEIKKLGCIFIETSMSRRGKNPFEDFGLFYAYRSILKEVKPDIVFSFTIKPNIYGGMACESFHVPYIANITGLGTAVERGGILQKITVMLYKLAFKNIQKVFFQNTENMQFFVDHKIALGKHSLLPGSGVNLQRFVPLEYPLEETIEFVFISRIMKEKGIDQYLDAAKAIKEKYSNTRFHICGFCEEAYDEKLKEFQESGTIIYHGMVKDVREILKDVHCTVHPTYYPEGLSNVLLESCACARPIITTDRSGCREVVENGVNGFIIKQQDSNDLIEKVEKFIQLPYEQKRLMGLNGRKKVAKEFDRKVVVEAYVEEVDSNESLPNCYKIWKVK